jgi:hypothetical protein
MIRKSSGHAWGIHAIILFLSVSVIPTAAYSEDAYRVVDGKYLVTTWSVFKKTMKYKMKGEWPSKPVIDVLNSLSDEEFSELAGNYTVFGMCDLKPHYDRKLKAYVLWYDANTREPKQGYLDPYMRNGNLNDFPIVCGVGDLNLIAEVNARLVEQPIIDPPDLFKGKIGGEYLTAIYIGDFEKQSSLARRYLGKMSNGLSGAMARLMGGLAQTGSDRLAKQDLSVLEEVLSTYMSQFSRNGESCLADGWIERRHTYELQDDVYSDEYGIETGRIDGGTRTTIYKLNKEFAEACDNLCATGGSLALSSMSETKMSRNKEDTLGSVFFGIIEMLENNNCSNPEVKQFEKSLLAMYAKERAVPQRDRNTLQNILYPNR